jgi:hypothetical protein
MGLYGINCIQCGFPFVWFSGTMDQRCENCRKGNEEVKNFSLNYDRQMALFMEILTDTSPGDWTNNFRKACEAIHIDPAAFLLAFNDFISNQQLLNGTDDQR